LRDTDLENPTGYFRKLLLQDPSLLKAGTNPELLRRWLADHPDQKRITRKVPVALSNAKTVMRKDLRKRRGRCPQVNQPALLTAGSNDRPSLKAFGRACMHLKEQIDDCLRFAKALDREALSDVIRLLRQARNRILCKQGQ
jgi:hypothetical protein